MVIFSQNTFFRIRMTLQQKLHKTNRVTNDFSTKKLTIKQEQHTFRWSTKRLAKKHPFKTTTSPWALLELHAALIWIWSRNIQTPARVLHPQSGSSKRKMFQLLSISNTCTRGLKHTVWTTLIKGWANERCDITAEKNKIPKYGGYSVSHT